jgi:transcriptional regulator with XRE-family HTH domain
VLLVGPTGDPGGGATVSDDLKSVDLAHRLDRLFDEVRPPGRGGRRYTNEEVAVAVKALNPDIRVGGAYLSALRNGTKKKPSTELLAALARHFGMPISYFFDEEPAARGDGAAGELARLADNTQVRRLALRALDLTPEGLAEVAELVERVLADEYQPPEDPGGTTASG